MRNKHYIKHNIVRTVAAMLIAATCIIAPKYSVLAVGSDGSGADTVSGFMPRGIESANGGSLVYLVDTEGYASSWSQSYLFSNAGGLNALMYGAGNQNVVEPRVGGISKPSGIEGTAPFGASWLSSGSGMGFKSNVDGIKEWAKTGHNASKFVEQYWGSSAKEAFLHDEIYIAIELVAPVGMSYQCDISTTNSSNNKTSITIKDILELDKGILSEEISIQDKNKNEVTLTEKASLDATYRIKLPKMARKDMSVRDLLEYFIDEYFDGAESSKIKESLSSISTLAEAIEKYGDASGEVTSNSSETGYVLWYPTNGYNYIIGTPRNIEEFYRKEGGMQLNGNKFGYKIYRTEYEAKKAGDGFGADNCYLYSWVGLSDNCPVAGFDVYNRNGNRINGSTNGARYANPFSFSKGWHNLVLAMKLDKSYGNLYDDANSTNKGACAIGTDIMNPHSKLGIMFIKNTEVEEEEPEEPEVIDADYILEQHQLSDEVDLLHDIHDLKHAETTYKWRQVNMSFNCGEVTRAYKGSHGYCTVCHGHHKSSEMAAINSGSTACRCGYLQNQCELCGAVNPSNHECPGNPIVHNGYYDENGDGKCDSCGNPVYVVGNPDIHKNCSTTTYGDHYKHTHSCEQRCYPIYYCSVDTWENKDHALSNKVKDVSKHVLAWKYTGRYQFTMSGSAEAIAFLEQVKGEAESMNNIPDYVANTDNYYVSIYKGTNNYQVAKWKIGTYPIEIDEGAYKGVDVVNKADKDLVHEVDYSETCTFNIKGMKEDNEGDPSVDFEYIVYHSHRSDGDVPEDHCTNIQWIKATAHPQATGTIVILNKTYYDSSDRIKDVSCETQDLCFIDHNRYYVSLVDSGYAGDVNFQPYYTMTCKDLQLEGEVNILANKSYTISNIHGFAGLLWLHNNGVKASPETPNLVIDSNQWSLDLNANSNHGGGDFWKGGRTVLPGGASFTLTSNTRAKNANKQGQILAYAISIEPILKGEGKIQVENTGGSGLEDGEDSGIIDSQKAKHDDIAEQIAEGIRGCYFEQRISNKGLDEKVNIFDSSWMSVGNNTNIKNKLNNAREITNSDSKYYLKQDPYATDSGSACFEVLRTTPNGEAEWRDISDDEYIEITYKSDSKTSVVTATITGSLYSIGTSATDLVVAGADSYGNAWVNGDTGNVWVDMVTNSTGVPLAMAKCLDKLRGEDFTCEWGANWYNEAMDGISFRIIASRMVMGTVSDRNNRKLPTERLGVLDPALCPSSDGKFDNFSRFNVSYFRSANNNLFYNGSKISTDYGEAAQVAIVNGVPMYLLGLEDMYMSQLFWIPNVTVDDLY